MSQVAECHNYNGHSCFVDHTANVVGAGSTKSVPMYYCMIDAINSGGNKNETAKMGKERKIDRYITCEPDGTTTESSTQAHDLPTLVTSDMVALFIHIGGYLL